MADWWINNSGQNMLAGIPGDSDNPAMLDDSYILDFLTRIPVARASFNLLYPTMSADEQARLDEIVKMADNGYVVDDVSSSDRFQHAINTPRLQRGGGWMPPPFRG